MIDDNISFEMNTWMKVQCMSYRPEATKVYSAEKKQKVW